MLHSATTKLTLSYLAIIMTMSLGFSIFLYRVSSGELDRGLRRPPETVQFVSGQFIYEQFRQDRIDEGNMHLRSNLIVFNAISLTFGSLLSFVLARRALEPIEEAMAVQSRFTADASHELRTPLAAIQTEIEVALRNPKLDVKQAKDLLNSNLEEVGKLKSLSDSLLRLARQDGQSLVLERVSLEKVTGAAVDRIKAAAKTNKTKIIHDIKPIALTADQDALTEALVILLDNAIKYSGPGKTITLSAKKSSHQVIISIKDEGIGISKSDLPHVFERFYRADSSRSKVKSEGYGLGLAIASQVVSLHNGTIKAESQPGKGSTFTLSLPSQS